MSGGGFLRLRERRRPDYAIGKGQSGDGQTVARRVDCIIPVNQRPGVGRDTLQLLRDLRVSALAAGAELAHAVAVEKVNRSFFANARGKMRIGPGLIGQNEDRLAQILVVTV